MLTNSRATFPSAGRMVLTPKYPATPREASWTPASHVSYSASRPAFTCRLKTSVTGPVIRPISSPPVIDCDAGLAVVCSISAERGSAFPHAIACRGQVLRPSRWACKCHTFPSWCTPRHNALYTGGERTRPGLIDISATRYNNIMTRFVLVSHQLTTPEDLGGTHGHSGHTAPRQPDDHRRCPER